MDNNRHTHNDTWTWWSAWYANITTNYIPPHHRSTCIVNNKQKSVAKTKLTEPYTNTYTAYDNLLITHPLKTQPWAEERENENWTSDYLRPRNGNLRSDDDDDDDDVAATVAAVAGTAAAVGWLEDAGGFDGWLDEEEDVMDLRKNCCKLDDACCASGGWAGDLTTSVQVHIRCT